MHHSLCGEALRIRAKKFKQNLRENFAKSNKIAITACEFSKISEGACPRTPLELLLFLSQLKISLVLPKKIRLKKELEIISPIPYLNFSLHHWCLGQQHSE